MENKTQHWLVGIFLAWRSISRGNVGTLVMTILMLSLIFINLIFLTSIINGVTVTANKQIIEAITGEIFIEAKTGDSYLTKAKQIERDLRLITNVQHVSPRTGISTELDFAGKSGSYRGMAINPNKEAAVTTVAQHMVTGRWLTTADTNAIVLGSQIAGKPKGELFAYSLKGVQVGDIITLKFTNGFAKDFNVVGIFDNDFVQADNRFFINQTEHDTLFPNLKDNVTEFGMKLTPNANLAAAVTAINELDISDNVRTWEDAAGITASFTKSFDIVNFIVSFVAIIVAGITIFIVMYVDVINRRKQIGILRAIGITETAIAISYILRAIFYAIIGIILGFIAFKLLIIPLFITKPLHLPIGNVSLSIDNSLLYMRALSILVVAFLGSYIPIQRTLRMRIIDAIWGE
ncbi:MAG: FtsX-like permease family protein [Patescibacteria group bacterium]